MKNSEYFPMLNFFGFHKVHAFWFRMDRRWRGGWAAGMLAPELVLTIAGTGTLAPSYAPTAILSEDPSPKPSRKPTQKVRYCASIVTPQCFVLFLTLTCSLFIIWSQQLKPPQRLLRPLFLQKILQQLQRRCLSQNRQSLQHWSLPAGLRQKPLE